jgi:two-component system nitrate/nitrite response regulator NarL
MGCRPFATILVSPSVLIREGLARILNPADFRIVSSATSIHHIVMDAVAHQEHLLLIIDFGDDPDTAVEQIKVYKEWHPSGRVAVCAYQDKATHMVSAFRAGANAYFDKVTTGEAFVKTLELVILGQTILPPEFTLVEGQHDTIPAMPHEDATDDAWRSTGGDEIRRLTDRERCILRYLIEGDSNKIIGRKIGIAETTVKVHVKAILRKIRVRNRTQAAIWAMNKSLSVTPDHCVAGPVASRVLRRDTLALAAVDPEKAVQLSHLSVASVNDISGLQQKSPGVNSG